LNGLGFCLGEGLWRLSAEGLMGPVVVVGDEIFEELVGEVIEVLEGCAFDDVVIEGSPKALDLAVIRHDGGGAFTPG
jgi:hypothetical protein